MRIDKHLSDIVEGRATEMFEIKEFADILHIHPTHLTTTATHHPCFYFEHKILEVAKSLLEKNEENISAIATRLTYDPSNFTNSSKIRTHQTNGKFLNNSENRKTHQKTETLYSTLRH